jgi:predicted PurR-regulated permease PerM
MKQVVVIGTAVMTTLLALVVLWQFRIVVVYVLISLALAATVRPLVVDWKRRGLVMRLVLIFLYTVSLGGFGFLIFHVGRFAVSDIQHFAQTLSVQGAWVLPPWVEGSSFQRALVARLPTPEKLFEALTGERGQLVLPAVLGFTEGIGGVASGAFLVLFLSIYWSINQVHFERLWLSLLPAEQRKQARGIWRTIEPNLGAYIRSEIAQSLLAALLLGLGYWLLGSRYPVLMALTGALAWLIPVVGAPLAMILPLLMGLLTSVQLSLFTILYTLVVLIALQVWVEPRLFKRKWDNPILTLVIVLAMADAFGLPGIIAAPPVSAVCQILWNLLVSNRLGSGAAVQVSDLKERQAHLWTVIKGMEEPPPPLVLSSMERLANLLEKAEPILPVVLPPEPSEPVREGRPPVSTKS